MRKKQKLNLDENQKELLSHGDYSFPIKISYEALSSYEGNGFDPHWHPELEFDLVLSGSMMVQVNGEKYLVSEGESIFCNSNCLHSGHLTEQGDCTYAAITFHPRLIYGYAASLIETKYVAPILNCPDLNALRLLPSLSWQRDILLRLREICVLYQQKHGPYEYHIRRLLEEIWFLLYENTDARPIPAPQTPSNASYAARLDLIITYLRRHYHEQISLESISALVGLSTNECCRFFKRYMSVSIFEYLLEYRIKCSLPLLLDGKHNITEAASAVGFSSSSYYTQVFKKYMGVSPSIYKMNAQ